MCSLRSRPPLAALSQWYKFVITEVEEKRSASLTFAGDPLSHHSNSLAFSGAASQSSVPSFAPAPLSPVSITLHRLYISIGDLHRYLAMVDQSPPTASPAPRHEPDYSGAEAQYQKAIRILPVNGNAYNQLAVLAQQKKQWFISLYMYCYR